MAAMGILQHNSSDGTPTGTRIESFGYTTPYGENISDIGGPRKVSPWETEGSYEADNDNMVVGSIGHRLTIMEPDSIGEVEIGVASTANGNWNTEDFGGAYTTPLLTGAVFTDNAGTGFYQSGEGVGSVTVTAPGASSYYAVTTPSGAYTLPLDLVAPVYAWGTPYYYDPNAQTMVYSPLNPVPTVQVVFTDAAGNVTTKAVTLTHTVGADGNSTYYDAAGNVRFDNAGVDLVRPAVVSTHPVFFRGKEGVGVSTHPVFFRGKEGVGNSVYYLALPDGNVFGFYAYLPDARFIYHFDLGYEYVQDAGDGRGGMYLYDFASGGWFYTSQAFAFPYLYDFALHSVVYYYPDPNHPGRYNTNGVRYFYCFGTGQIIVQ